MRPESPSDLGNEKLKNAEDFFEHSYGRSGVFEQHIESSNLYFKYSSVNPIEFIKVLLNKKVLFDYQLKNLEIFKNLRRVDDFVLENNNKAYSIKDIVPSEYNVYFYIKKHPLLSSGVNPQYKTVFINDDPLTKTGLLTMAHEIGHLEDDKIITDELRKKRRHIRFLDNMFEIVKSEDKKIMFDEERAAWAYALKNLRHFFKDLQINTDKANSFIHQECLESYSENVKVFSDLVIDNNN